MYDRCTRRYCVIFGQIFIYWILSQITGNTLYVVWINWMIQLLLVVSHSSNNYQICSVQRNFTVFFLLLLFLLLLLLLLLLLRPLIRRQYFFFLLFSLNQNQHVYLRGIFLNIWTWCHCWSVKWEEGKKKFIQMMIGLLMQLHS